MHLAVSKEYYWSLPSWKVAKDNGLVLGVILLFGGSDGGPQGPRWLVHGPMPGVRWFERRNGTFAVLRKYYWSLLSLKVAKENRLVLGVNIVVWGLRWGYPGAQMADTWPLAMGGVG